MVIHRGPDATKFIGRRTGGDRVQAVGELVGELQGNRTADGFLDHVRLVKAQGDNRTTALRSKTLTPA
jgi:hypothetical protein